MRRDRKHTTFRRTTSRLVRTYFPYKRGAPSHDTLGRVFANLDVIEFNKCFMNRVESISDLCHGRVIALDGKTICGAASTAALGSKLHIVSAFCNKNNLSIGQLTVAEKKLPCAHYPFCTP